MGLGKCSSHILVGYCQEDPGAATPAAHVLGLPSSGNLWALESKCQKKRCWEEVLVSGKSVSVTGQWHVVDVSKFFVLGEKTAIGGFLKG